MELEKVDLEDVADLCKTFFVYARGGSFRAEPVGDVLWLITKLLGLGRHDCRLNFVEDWRKKTLKHGLDPTTGERLDEGAFETAVRTLVAKNAQRHRVKEARKTLRDGEAQGSESNGEITASAENLTPESLTLVGTKERELLRAINRKLGCPRKPPLPDPKSLYWPGEPARSPIPAKPQKESSGSSSCQQKPAGVSRPRWPDD